MDQETYTKICERLSRIEVLLEQNSKADVEIKAQLADHEKRLVEVENAPVKKDAGRWQYIVDYIFKFVVAAVIVYAATKLGIK